ncbi:MAG TPA: HEAT repeat domain-containing protein [Gemmatimonadaceae bacterium]|nr:HEAT repeat domain-containing protein [Gemmatimonadaceae bacterium]
MRFQRTKGVASPRLGWLAPAGVLTALACQSVAVPSSSPAAAPVAAPAAAPARALVSVPVPAFTPTTVRLTPDSAVKAAEAGRTAMSAQVAPGLELKLWAPEGMIADPIGIAFDERGRLYVTQTTRTDRDEIDIRAHQDWMVPSITFKDVEDKRAFYQRVLAPENSAKNQWLQDWNKDGSRDWRDLTFHKEKLWRVEDTNGDGVADQSQLVLEDFNDLVSDVLHDVLVFRDTVYVTISPDLWRLRDTNNDGVFDAKESLSHGSGVHIGFGGHGHSGPRVGPDGRLYWKQGDLGVNITTREGRKLVNPNSGVILRANLDGTEEEIFASGLRNPQDFEFDDYGNLISPDNDGDHPGETERIVYIVDGMDSGWRINWQFGKYVDPDNNTYKVWMEESMFKPRFAGQAAWFTPPVAAWHAGPSGFAYNPGTALSDAWKGYFFNSVFTGAPARASIQAFKLAPQGAGFRLTNDTAIVRNVLTTGVRFGPDGALYLADWVEGWEPKERGRIWKVDVPASAANPLRAEVKTLIAADFKTKSAADLTALLRHADRRVRQKAQFELADRGASAELLASVRQTEHQLARIHGMWGIAQLARKDSRQAASLVPFLKDGDAEIRAQATKLLGDLRYGAVASTLVPMLGDATPRVRFFAAEALGRIGHRPAFQPIVAMLAANNDEDVYLRHAGALALSRIGPADAIASLLANPSRAVRVAAVVALRRLKDAGVARFLADQDEYVVTEAARAINDDGGIPAALPQLAAVLEGKFTGEPLVRRALNANLRVGTADAARRVGTYAGGATGNEEMRVEAIAVLGVWPKPSILDRVDGTHLGTMERDSAMARAAIAPLVQPIFASGSTAMQVALAEAVGKLGVKEAGPTLLAKVQSAPQPEIRIAALRALAAMRHERVADAVRGALQDKESTVRMAALTAIPPLNLPEATTTELLGSVIGKGSIAEQQSALQAMGQVPGSSGREAMTRLVQQLEEGKLAPEIQLDVAEAARASKDQALIARLDKLTSGRAGAKPVETFADALRGGDARRGARVAFQAPAAQCTRCHTFGGPGANVGPSLSGVASRLSREQLLEALVDPSARIAPGFGPVQLTLKSGKKLFGTLKEETATHVVVDAGGDQRVAKSDIAQRTNGPSAMPPMGSLLTRREIRDLVEYLSTLKAP